MPFLQELDRFVQKAAGNAVEARRVAAQAMAIKANSSATYMICFECHGDSIKESNGTFTCIKCGVRFDERDEKI